MKKRKKRKRKESYDFSSMTYKNVRDFKLVNKPSGRNSIVFECKRLPK